MHTHTHTHTNTHTHGRTDEPTIGKGKNATYCISPKMHLNTSIRFCYLDSSQQLNPLTEEKFVTRHKLGFGHNQWVSFNPLAAEFFYTIQRAWR